jgi:hypothetical protein
LGLHDGYLSDHRALVVDFDAQSIFMSATTPVVSPSARRLTSTHPRAVHTYVHAMLKQIHTHRILDRVGQLKTVSECGQWTSDHATEWERIDRVLADARTTSERQCQAKGSGQTPWSPTLKKAGLTLLYWRLRLREYTSAQVNMQTLYDLEQSIGLDKTETAGQSYTTVRAKIRKARRDHNASKAEATKLREEFLRERATFLAATQGMSEAAACSAIETRERSSRQFWHLRSIFRQGVSSGLDRIDIPNSYAVLRPGEDIPRIPLVVKEDIEEVLIPHTVKMF